MAKKRKLSDLIGEETQQSELVASQSVTTEVSKSETNKVTDLQSNEASNSVSNKIPDSKAVELPSKLTDEVSDLQSNEVPKYLTLARKEARLREDQLDTLTSLARSLNRKRKGSGERITENTLIRIAVDLLMNQSDKLQGTTEEELSASVGLD